LHFLWINKVFGGFNTLPKIGIVINKNAQIVLQQIPTTEISEKVNYTLAGWVFMPSVKCRDGLLVALILSQTTAAMPKRSNFTYTGQLVQTIIAQEPEQQLDLPKGIYMLKVQGTNDASVKVVVN
jgi:hypothetical protein